MILKKSILLILLFIFYNGFSQTNLENLDSYFQKLKSYEFENINEEIPFAKNIEEYKVLKKLAILKQSDGQFFNAQSFLTQNLDSDSKLLKSIKLLLEANTEIVFQKSNTITFQKLTTSLKHSTDLNYDPLTKEILLGILKLYNSEIIQINNDHLEFLNEYRRLSNDKIDKFIYSLKSYHFISKSYDPDPNEYELAYNELKDSFELLPEKSKFFPFFHFEQGIYNEINKDYDEAEKHYKLTISKTSNDGFYRYINYGSFLKLSKIAEKKEDYVKALKLLQKTKLYNSTSSPQISNYYYTLHASQYYEGLKDYKNAYLMNSRASLTLDSINIVTNTNIRSQALIEYQTLEKEKQLLIAEKEKEQNRNIAIGLAGSIFFLGLIGFLGYKNTKRKQRIAEQETELEIQKKEKILKNQELNAIDAMISGQEKERQLVASDLHDSVGATLSAAKMQFHHLSQNRNDLTALDEFFFKTENLLDEAYQEVRSMAHIKNSGVIAKNGLLPAVKKLAKNASSTNGLQIEVEDFGLEERLESSLEIAIFRVIQELITNIIKHAKATEASISITQHQDGLSIIIEDNGIGFNSRAINKNEGMGLSSIEKRIEHLEGTLEVDSTLGRGTNILIDIPT